MKMIVFKIFPNLTNFALCWVNNSIMLPQWTSDLIISITNSQITLTLKMSRNTNDKNICMNSQIIYIIIFPSIDKNADYVQMKLNLYLRSGSLRECSLYRPTSAAFIKGWRYCYQHSIWPRNGTIIQIIQIITIF